jgi:hypothetical protein
MKRLALSVVLASALATPAHGAGQVGLHVGDCGTGSATAVSNACTSNSGTAFTLFVSCVVPPVTKAKFIGAVATLTIGFASDARPDWWRFDTCRPAGDALYSDASMGGSCPTLWDSATPAGNNLAVRTDDVTVPAYAERLTLGAVLYPADVHDLVGDGTTELSVFRLDVLAAKSAGTGACAGCTQGACIAINMLQLEGQDDQYPSDYLTLTEPLGSNWVTYDTGYPTCPASVPVRNRTWGSVKALYR